MTKKGIYKVPNSWILDGVNLSVESVHEWNVLDASIDAGWTYCGKVDKDETRFNKSVIRKQDANGKYIDTNNSTNDFIPGLRLLSSSDKVTIYKVTRARGTK